MLRNFLRYTMGIAGKHIPPVTRRIDGSLTVFLFHDVSDTPAPFTQENDAAVSTGLFKKQIQFIGDNFNVVAAESWLKGDLPQRAAIITFDDGYQGIFKNALPILRELQLPSVVFMNMGPVSGEGSWAEQVIYLCQHVKSFQEFLVDRGIAAGGNFKAAHLECDQEMLESYRGQGNDELGDFPAYIAEYASQIDLTEADDNPLVTLGSHSYTHSNLKHLSDQMLAEDYQKNAAALSGFKRYLPLFAFPFGHPGTCFTMDQARLLMKNGAARLFTTWPRSNPDPASKIIDRIGLSAQNDCEWRMWFPVVKLPIIETLRHSGPITGTRMPIEEEQPGRDQVPIG